MTRDEWLEDRRKSIGGSDAAAVIGLNRYRTPMEVYADKLGAFPPKEDTEAMRLGRDLEEYVAQRFCEETGKKVRRVAETIRNADFPFAHANIDRRVIGEKAGLECKFSNSRSLKRYKNGEFPEEYYTQCVHYLAVTGWERWYLAVVIVGVGIKIFTIERDDEEINALMNAERDFWNNHVLKGIPPEPQGTASDNAAINSLFKESENDAPVELVGFRDSLRLRDEIIMQIKTLAKEKQRIEQKIKIEMGENETAETEEYSVDWKTQTKTFFSKQLMHKVYPRLNIGKCMKVSRFRVMRIKRKEDANAADKD